MSEKWDITEEGTLVIKQNSPVDLKTLHKELYQWAQENKYFFNEKDFTEKVKSHGKEFGIKWFFEKKTTDFIKFSMDIEVWALLIQKSQYYLQLFSQFLYLPNPHYYLYQ